MTMPAKRYLAVIWPKSRGVEAALIAGYERDGKVLARGKRIGFAVDYYENELTGYKRDFGQAIIGNFASREEAEKAIQAKLEEGK
jgi:hypothetical protein